mmetsp:Transcript_23266/g.50652  ORF Transcript_23266/g.50652 Transcript_23266/m.50652 type:complete len:90 (-) Transcript_23266:83-352(-)
MRTCSSPMKSMLSWNTWERNLTQTGQSYGPMESSHASMILIISRLSVQYSNPTCGISAELPSDFGLRSPRPYLQVRLEKFAFCLASTYV